MYILNNIFSVYLMPDRIKRKTPVATNKNRQREPEFNTYLDLPLNIIEGKMVLLCLILHVCKLSTRSSQISDKSTVKISPFATVGFKANRKKSSFVGYSSCLRPN